MARFTQAEVLRRYQVGERDFRGADLRCLRFRGQTLAGADFSGADLRGTDFLDADLRGATFVGARCGVTWLRGLLERGAVVPFYSFFSGSIFSLTTSKFISVFFFGSESAIGHLDVTWASIATLIVLAALVVFAWEGFSAKGISFLVLSIYASALVAGAMASFSIARNYFGIGFAAGGVAAVAAACGVAFSAAAVATGVAFVGAADGAIALAFLGALSTSYPLVLHYAPDTAQDVQGLLAVVVSVAVAFVYVIFWSISHQRSRRKAIGYSGFKSIGLALSATSSTCFSGADLRGSFFNVTHLARVDFPPSDSQATRLEGVCWKGARGLELAQTRCSILAEPRSRLLLQCGSAPGTNLHGLNLRGAYLPQADLRGADLRETNLSEAVLTEAHLENANLKASQCLGTDLTGAHLTGATLEGWNIDHATQLSGVDCAYVYLLEPFDALGQRRDDHHRERLPHDPDKSFGPGDFETYFKQLIEEVKLLIKNGVDARAFQQAFQEVMRQHPQITPESVTGLKRSGNDVLVTLQAPASVDKGAVEQTFFDKYNAVKMENARLHGLLEGERRVSEVERERATQFAELASRLVTAANPSPHPTTVVNTTTIHTGDGNLINTGSLNTAGGLVNLGDLSDQARLTIEAIPDERTAVGQLSLRQLLQELKDSVDADSHLPESSRAEALAEINELAAAAQDPKKNGGPARRAINALKGLSAGLSETNKAVAESSKLVGAVKTLLPLIAGFFLG